MQPLALAVSIITPPNDLIHPNKNGRLVNHDRISCLLFL